jgi:2-iminobutanoate/2-iminopropanoate deaminase
LCRIKNLHNISDIEGYLTVKSYSGQENWRFSLDPASLTGNDDKGDITMSEKKVILTDAAPKAVGPYSQAVMAGNMFFASGQLGIDPATGKLVEGGAKEQARQALKNIHALLEAAGLNFNNIVQVQIFLVDLADFAQVNEVYKASFTEPYPARSTFQVAGLPLAAKVEIQTVAVK